MREELEGETEVLELAGKEFTGAKIKERLIDVSLVPFLIIHNDNLMKDFINLT